MVVEQRRKLFEMRNQYRIFDQLGSQIGAVVQVRQSPLAFLGRLITNMDVSLPTWLEVRGESGEPVFLMHKPWFRMTFGVSRPDGTALGSIRKRIRLGKARFTIAGPSGAEIGRVVAQNWRAKDFVVIDQTGAEIAQATKRWRGLATELFTDADTYVVELTPQAIEPLRSLALAAALTIDVVMKQKDG